MTEKPIQNQLSPVEAVETMEETLFHDFRMRSASLPKVFSCLFNSCRSRVRCKTISCGVLISCMAFIFRLLSCFRLAEQNAAEQFDKRIDKYLLPAQPKNGKHYQEHTAQDAA